MIEQPTTALAPRRTFGTLQTWALALLAALTAVTLYLRLHSLNSLPPWLWWYEATQGLDARELLHGRFQVFFLDRGPLYVYLTTPFVAVWDGQPFAVRLAGALLGVLQVPALYFLARALWRERPLVGTWAGLVAAGAWATSYWAQSVNRIGLQVNAMPLLLTLAATAWLNWTHRSTLRRAVIFGLFAGLPPMAYLADCVTPLLWLALFLSLSAAERRALKRSLPWALLAFALVVTPLLVHFARHPGDAMAQLNSFSTPGAADSGTSQATLLWERSRVVFGVFLGFAADPTPRYNIPGRLPFSLAMTALFVGGLLAALMGLRQRHRQSWPLLLWWLVMCAPAVMSANSASPFPRLLPALPAALLLAAWPVALAADWVSRQARHSLPHLALLVAVLLVVEGMTTGIDYFDVWPRETDLYTWYQGDVWSLADRALSGSPQEATTIIPIDERSAAELDYSFARAPLLHLLVSAESVENWLSTHLSGRGGSTIKTGVWEEEPYVYADAAQALPFYLAREGTAIGKEVQRGYQIHSYRLGPEPAFEAAGQLARVVGTFEGGLTLTGARWGTAYPNADRNGTVAAGGTSFWAILSWRADLQLKHKRVALDLVDANGRRLASQDSPLLDAAQERAMPWQPGTVLQTYHLVDVPATQPAGPVSFEVRVYDAQTLAPLLPAIDTTRLSLPLARAHTTFAAAAGALPETMRPLPQPMSPQLQLLGVDPWPGSVAPGQVMVVRLYWQLVAPLGAPLPVVAGLGDTGVTAVERVAAETPVGIPQSTQIELRLPSDLSTGAYQLWLAIDGSAGSRVVLGQVTANGRPRVFAVPPLALPASSSFGRSIALLGMDVPQDLAVRAGQSVTVTLAWQALNTPAGDWVRFLHALGPDGKPVTQIDGQPCGGDCPASSWQPGEVLVERLELAVPADLPAGIYPLATGWYDPAAPGMPRLPAQDATGTRLPDDLARLPARLVVRR